jgi:hypothetical protein
LDVNHEFQPERIEGVRLDVNHEFRPERIGGVRLDVLFYDI